MGYVSWSLEYSEAKNFVVTTPTGFVHGISLVLKRSHARLQNLFSKSNSKNNFQSLKGVPRRSRDKCQSRGHFASPINLCQMFLIVILPPRECRCRRWCRAHPAPPPRYTTRTTSGAVPNSTFHSNRHQRNQPNKRKAKFNSLD